MTAVLVKQPSEGLGIKSKDPALETVCCMVCWWLHLPAEPYGLPQEERAKNGSNSPILLGGDIQARGVTDYTFPRSGRILF